MAKFYTDEVDVQIVLALLKKHGCRAWIVSPGSTNHTAVLSAQNDPFFKLYSCVDERSAAYMACGLASELGEPVVLSCTAATASRNYFPALTEAFYRKLPIVALTSTRTVCQVGNLIDQQIDRSVQPKDTVKISVNLPYVKDDEDFWECELSVNKALLELNHHGMGPVHINMPTRYDTGYNCKTLPDVRCIRRFMKGDVLPEIPRNQKIGIYIGSHQVFDVNTTKAIDKFCEIYNSVVFYEHTSNYKGKYGVNFYQSWIQKNADYYEFLPETVIDLGEVASLARMRGTKNTWRLSEDGQLKDPHKNLQYVFEMPDKDFFEYYSKGDCKDTFYFDKVSKYANDVYRTPVALSFSNVYAASMLAPLMPKNCVIHFGILNSLRSYSFFDIDNSIDCYANTGGYGIDGGVSTLIGSSIANRDKLHFGIFGDLCFFYDMNSIGNRHVSNNLRIMLVNNGLGEEFKTFFNYCYPWGEETNPFVAAEGHFGKKSPLLVKHYAEDLGFKYICASNDKEFEDVYKDFVVPNITEKPILFEIFTTDENENQALFSIMHKYISAKGTVKNVAKKVLGEKGTKFVKEILGK